jgi:PTH1 family peptidyl-tRNA hydrolase
VLAVIGLGNPGSRYAATRHNAGFMVVDWLVTRAGARWIASPLTHSQVALVALAGREVLLAKPQTFMNQSGLAVAALSRQFACGTEELLIVLDDFLLDFGRLRLRRGGSDGGHHGLASVLEQLGTQAVARLRVGIGQPPPGAEVIDYVLSPFAAGEAVAALIERGAQAADCWVEAGIEAAMNCFNGG